jgi:pimeloyl-ACP methyl ester carboxylesterase
MVGVAGTRIVHTAAGPVEVRVLAGHDPPVLMFPGGHSSAATPTGEDIYTDIGRGVVVFSRPGYGRTDVGRLTAAEFTPVVVQACRELGIERAAAAVGVSFGGLQALHIAVVAPELISRLVLHSCAPSQIPFPDTRKMRILGPRVFAPGAQRSTWWVVRRLIYTDAGLKFMMGSLTTLPDTCWWPMMSSDDRRRAREMFAAMHSGSGFTNDLRQADRRLSAYRARLQAEVAVPTLITASLHDGAVSITHAHDFAATIRPAMLVKTSAPTHLYWIGPGRTEITSAVAAFLT